MSAIYLESSNLCLFLRPIITFEALDRFALYFDRGIIRTTGQLISGNLVVCSIFIK